MSGYQLYWSPNTGAFAPQVVLELAGIGYRRIVLDPGKEEHRRPEYRALNPMAQIPTLILPDGKVLTESAAMMLLLAERHPQTGLLPPPGSSERGLVYRWLIFLAVNVYEASLRIAHPERYANGDCTGAVRESAQEALARSWAIFASALEPGPLLLGTQHSVADLYALMLSDWTAEGKAHAAMQRLRAKLLEDPVVRRVWKEHRVD